MSEIIIYGIGGAMGENLVDVISADPELNIAAGVENFNSRVLPVDIEVFKNLTECVADAAGIIDFSHPDNLNDILNYGEETGNPLLICTTGFSEKQHQQIKEAGKKCPVLLSTNTSYGINLFQSILKQFVPFLGDKFDIELIEKHHNRKKDAPSGTAKTLLDTIKSSLPQKREEVYDRHESSEARAKNEIGVHTIRGGSISGEHSVIFAGEDEIIEIKHTALSKKVFARGAVEAFKWLSKQSFGYYLMEDMFKGE